MEISPSRSRSRDRSDSSGSAPSEGAARWISPGPHSTSELSGTGRDYCPRDYIFVSDIFANVHKLTFRAKRWAPNPSKALPVIIKILLHRTEEALAQLVREYELFLGLQEFDLVPRILEFQHDRGLLVLEDPGGDAGEHAFAQCVRDSDPFRCLGQAILLAKMINHLHARRIYHNDLKPRALLFLPDRVYLIDLELARRFDEARGPSQEVLAGTLPYMSPEQTGRLGTLVDYRADLYSLGVLLFQMWMGRLPFEQTDLMQLVHAIISQPAPLIISMTPSLSSDKPPTEENKNTTPRSANCMVVSMIVSKLLAKAPDARYQSAYGLVHDLQHCLDELKSTGSIPEFDLGTRDRPIVLRFWQSKIYGRAAEETELRTAYKHFRTDGAKRCVLIRGGMGIGKSSLVGQLRPVIASSNGILLQGKYLEHRETIPFYGFVQAATQLARWLLTMSDSELTVERSRLTQSLGPAGGQVLVELVPQFEQVFGAQTTTSAFSRTASSSEQNNSQAVMQNRFQKVFLRFLEHFARPEHPLVIFLDDMQWADVPSMKLLQAILASESIKSGLLLIIAYREVNLSHPLHPFLESAPIIMGAKLSSIHLGPISAHSVVELLSDTLYLPSEIVAPLAMLLHRKALGNPFFIFTLLKELYERRLVWYDCEKGIWDFSMAAISGNADLFNQNLASLLACSMTQLAEERRRLLLLAACVGIRFTVPLLVAISSQQEEQIRAELLHFVEQTYLVPESDGSYRFSHDSLFEAAYKLGDTAHREMLHLKIGRWLVETLRPEQLDEQLFDVTACFNSGSSMLSTPQERDLAIDLNFRSSRRAKRSSAYESMKSYLEKAIQLLGAEGWDRSPSLAYQLHFDMFICQFLMSKMKEAKQLFTLLTIKAQTSQDKAALYEQYCSLLFSEGEHETAVTLGLECLKSFGQNISANPTEAEAGAEIQKVLNVLEKTDISSLLQLPSSPSPWVVDLLNALQPSAFVYRPLLYLLLAARAVLEAIATGITAATCQAIVSMSLVIADFNPKYRLLAFELARCGVELGQTYGGNLSALARAVAVQAFYINWFEKHVSDSLGRYRQAHAYAQQAFDYLLVALLGNYTALTLFSMGESVDAVILQARENLTEEGRSNTHHSEGRHQSQAMILTLSAMKEGGPEHLRQWMVDFEARLKTPHEKSWYLVFKTIFFSLFEDHATAVHAAEECQKYIFAFRLHLCQPHFWFHFLVSLLALIASNYDTALGEAIDASAAAAAAVGMVEVPVVPRVPRTQQVELCMERLMYFFALSPTNCRHILTLAKAECTRVLKRQPAEAIAMFSEGILQAEEHGSVYWQAVGSMLAEQCCNELRSHVLAKHMARDAHGAFVRWGAGAVAHHYAVKFQLMRSHREHHMSNSPRSHLPHSLHGGVSHHHRSNTGVTSINIHDSISVSASTPIQPISRASLPVNITSSGVISQSSSISPNPLTASGLIRSASSVSPSSLPLLPHPQKTAERRSSYPLVSTLGTLLDVETVIKVARALSQEIILENLLERVMLLLSENTNADRILLALTEDESTPQQPKRTETSEQLSQSFKLATKSTNLSSSAKPLSTSGKSIPNTVTPEFESRSLVVVASLMASRASGREHLTLPELNDQNAMEIMRYVYQSNEDVLLENAYASNRFCAPPPPPEKASSQSSSSSSGSNSAQISPSASTSVNHPVRAVLCIPLGKKLSRSGVLYLENSSFEAAFNESRVQLMHAIAPQIGICIDNAQLVRKLTVASNELQQRNAELKREDERKDTFLAVTTHELRTPLNGVIGATSLLLETPLLSAEQQEYVAMIQNSSKSLLMLVNDILDLTKLQSSRLRIENEAFSLATAIDAALELVGGAAAAKDIELAYVMQQSPAPPEFIFADSGRLIQILTNLMYNSIKFTEKGTVLLSVGCKWMDNDRVHLLLSVRDTGVGIPPEKIKNLFKMFSQLDSADTRRYGGYGVGLFLCQKLLELLGGSIRAESDGRTGSVFHVVFPALIPTAAAAAAAAAASTSALPLINVLPSPAVSPQRVRASSGGSLPQLAPPISGRCALLWVAYDHTKQLIETELHKSNMQTVGLARFRSPEIGFSAAGRDLHIPTAIKPTSPADLIVGSQAPLTPHSSASTVPSASSFSTSNNNNNNSNNTTNAGSSLPNTNPAIVSSTSGPLHQRSPSGFSPPATPSPTDSESSSNGTASLENSSRTQLQIIFSTGSIYESISAEEVATFESLVRSHQLAAASSGGAPLSACVDVVITELAYMNQARVVLENAGMGNVPIVVLAYPQHWRQCVQRTRLTPLFKPILHAKLISTIQNSMKAISRSASPLPQPRATAVNRPRTPDGLFPSPGAPLAPRQYVLVVEDNPTNNKLLRAIISQQYDFASAMNGQEALNVLAESTRPFDLVLMDVQMPVMDGLTATRHLRARGLVMPVVAATASFSQADKAQCLEAGMNDVLPKPFTKNSVIEMIQKYLGAGTPNTTHRARTSSPLRASHLAPPTTAASSNNVIIAPIPTIASTSASDERKTS